MVDGFNLSGLQAAVRDHDTVVRVVIAAHAGSAPRETGAAMLVWQGGQSGTIGGGTLEFEAATRARDLLGSDNAKQVLKFPLGPALGQCCGGAVTLILEKYDEKTLPALMDDFHTRPITAATAHRPLSVTRAIKNMRNKNEPFTAVYVDGWLIETLGQDPQPLWLYGAGHVGREIVAVLAGLPYDITWIDTGLARFPDNIPANATPLVAQNPGDVVRHAPANAHHLVLTYSHAFDLDICHKVLSRDFAALGVIGSATKRKRFQSRLAALGHTQTQISRMICPIGQRNLGKTPRAIAIGVAADMIAPNVRHQTRKEARL